MTASRKTPPQIVAVEAIVITGAAIGAYFLAKGTGHSVAVFFAGVAVGLATRLVTRHAAPKRKRRTPRRRPAPTPARRRS